MNGRPKEGLRPYPEPTIGGWDIAKSRAAIESMERGHVRDVARLIRALARDPRYVQGREQFTAAVLGCPADIVAAPIAYDGAPEARRLAAEAGEVLADVLRGGAEKWLIEWGKAASLAIGYLAWDTTRRPWRPVSLTRWPLDSVRVDLYQRRLFALTQEGEIEIIPGDGTWVVYAPSGLLNFDAALVRCFAEAFVSRRFVIRDMGNRTNGASIAALQGEAKEGASEAELDDYEAKVKALQTGSEAGIIRRSGWPKIETLDLGTDNTTTLFQQGLTVHTADLINPWLGQDGTANAGGSGGSYAKLRVLDGVVASFVADTVGSLWGEQRADLSFSRGCLTSQVLGPWVRYQGLDPERVGPLAIRRVPDTEEDARLSAESERAAAWRMEIKELRELGYKVTDAHARGLAKTRGVRIPEDLRLGEPAAPPPAPSPGPPDPVEDLP